jgi:hypothetical protein
VKQETPSCGFRDLYKSAGQNVAEKIRTEADEGVEKTLAVAPGREIAHNVSIETIE